MPQRSIIDRNARQDAESPVVPCVIIPFCRYTGVNSMQALIIQAKLGVKKAPPEIRDLIM